MRLTRLVTTSALVLVLPLAACGSGDGGGGASSVASLADWCERIEQANELGDALDDATFDPEALGAVMREYRVAVDELSDVAPLAVVDDLAVLTDGVVRLDEALAAADYRVLDADLAAIDQINDDLDEASERMQAFNEGACGFEPGDDAPDGAADLDDLDFDPAAGTIREQLVAEFVAGGLAVDEAECLVDNIDIAVFAGDDQAAADEVGAILEVFELCEIPLERLLELGD